MIESSVEGLFTPEELHALAPQAALRRPGMQIVAWSNAASFSEWEPKGKWVLVTNPAPLSFVCEVVWSEP